jgi:hypothetical protein
MPSRDRKGRFKKGMGSIITVRRKGAGMGALKGNEMLTESVMPPLIGGGVAALVALAIRYWVNPAEGKTQLTMVKWAPLFGLATGGLASLALMFFTGTSSAVSSFLSASAVGMYGLGHDFVAKEHGGRILAATLTNGANGAAAVEGYRRRGMGAIVMEPTLASGRRAGTIGAIVPEYSTPPHGAGIGSYGEVVNLQGLGGINTTAFGTPGFQA